MDLFITFASCYFYGSHNNGTVTINEMVQFDDGFDTIRLVKLNVIHTINPIITNSIFETVVQIECVIIEFIIYLFNIYVKSPSN